MFAAAPAGAFCGDLARMRTAGLWGLSLPPLLGGHGQGGWGMRLGLPALLGLSAALFAPGIGGLGPGTGVPGAAGLKASGDLRAPLIGLAHLSWLLVLPYAAAT